MPQHEHTVERATEKEARASAAAFVNANHSYIKWADRPSRKLYWRLFEDGRLVGVFGLGSAFIRPKAVADFVAQRGIMFNEVANNIVYCLGGHEDENAGTKLLALVRKDAILWWKERYDDNLRLFQTFILPPRNGSVYKADNWQQIGVTAGATQATRTIRPSDLAAHPDARKRVFASGEVRYTIRTFVETPAKLIFVREVGEKERRRALRPLQQATPEVLMT